jgi:glycosyltransferase involved in cell wall biosynthesis
VNFRALSVQKALRQATNSDSTWLERIDSILKHDSGVLYSWLAVTGCYPTKHELQEYKSDIDVNGFQVAVQTLITRRIKDIDNANKLAKVNLVIPSKRLIVDVTHTYSAPYLTGIQRVVVGVTKNVNEVATFIWVGTTGILQERELHAQTSELHAQTSWRMRTVFYLHSLVPKLESTALGKALRVSLLPIARRLKRTLITQEVESELGHEGNENWSNLLIANCQITLPEIPSLIEHISAYEAILEYQAAEIQVILYDFIPFFHAWTVHPGNRGHFSSYIRLVFLSNRVISISHLVQQQAELIIKAFRLERDSWSGKRQEFSYLALPSGLTPAAPNEFNKQPNLVVMAGSIEPRKNHLQFLDALEILAIQGISIKGEILGSAGWENDHILDRMHHLQARGVSVSRIGNLSDHEMRQHIGEAKILLQISEAEGFGLPIAEALALNTRVIVSNIRPLNEWAGKHVEVVQLGDAIGLAGKISTWLKEDYEIDSKPQVSWKDWTDLLYRTK